MSAGSRVTLPYFFFLVLITLTSSLHSLSVFPGVFQFYQTPQIPNLLLKINSIVLFSLSLIYAFIFIILEYNLMVFCDFYSGTQFLFSFLLYEMKVQYFSLRKTLTTSHKFWYVMFSLLFGSKYFLRPFISLWINKICSI